MSRYTIDLPENHSAKVLKTELTTEFVLGVLREHGADYDEFEAERKTDWRKPVTLGELRDWLGY